MLTSLLPSHSLASNRYSHRAQKMDELDPSQLAFGTVAAVSVAAAYWWGQSGGKKVVGDSASRVSIAPQSLDIDPVLSRIS